MIWIPLAVVTLIVLCSFRHPGQFFHRRVGSCGDRHPLRKVSAGRRSWPELEGALRRFRCRNPQSARRADQSDHGDENQGQRLECLSFKMTACLRPPAGW